MNNIIVWCQLTELNGLTVCQSSMSIQEKDWVCLRYLHTHSLEPVLCAQPIFMVRMTVALVGNQQLSSISLLILVAGGFMVVSLQEGWNGSGEPLDTDFLGFQMLHNYVLAFFLHWFCLHGRLACCVHIDQRGWALQQIPHAVLKLLYPGRATWILASKLY